MPAPRTHLPSLMLAAVALGNCAGELLPDGPLSNDWSPSARAVDAAQDGSASGAPVFGCGAELRAVPAHVVEREPESHGAHSDAGSLPSFAAGLADSGLASKPTDAGVVITIPNGSGGGNHHFPAEVHVKLGMRVSFFNADSIAHQMHINGVLPHAPTPSQPGQSYVVTANTVGSADFYCHLHGGGQGKVIVDAL